MANKRGLDGSKSGEKYIYPRGNGNFIVSIPINGEQLYFGFYHSIEEAIKQRDIKMNDFGIGFWS